MLWFNKTTRQFGDVAKSNFHGNCVLQLSHVICRSATANQRTSPAASESSAIIVSAGTDGRICVWNVTAVVMGFCQRLLIESENEISPELNCCAEDGKSFTSLTETVFRDVAEQPAGDSSQNIEGCDTQTAFNSTVAYVGSLRLTEATERQAVIHSSSYTAGSCEVNKASERRDSELEPCCVVAAHQSGINSLAVRLRLTGSLCFLVV